MVLSVFWSAARLEKKEEGVLLGTSVSIWPGHGVASTHSGDGAQLRKPEAALEPFVLITDEAKVEIDVVGDEDPVAHEPHEAVRDFGEYAW
jgi:hypothetical protein